MDEAEALVKRHEELEARLAAQDERLASFSQRAQALEKLPHYAAEQLVFIYHIQMSQSWNQNVPKIKSKLSKILMSQNIIFKWLKILHSNVPNMKSECPKILHSNVLKYSFQCPKILPSNIPKYYIPTQNITFSNMSQNFNQIVPKYDI